MTTVNKKNSITTQAEDGFPPQDERRESFPPRDHRVGMREIAALSLIIFCISPQKLDKTFWLIPFHSTLIAERGFIHQRLVGTKVQKL